MSRFFYLVIVLLLTVPTAIAQTTVTINAGTFAAESFGSGPIYRASASSTLDISQYTYLYTSGELNAIPAGSQISGIAWNKTNDGATTLSGGGKFKIYLKNSIVPSFSAAGVLFNNTIQGATLVYSNDNTIIPATAGFLQFPLSTPFVYTGGNLEVTVDWNINGIAGNPSSSSFYWQRTTTSKKIYGFAASNTTTGKVLWAQGDSTGDISNTRPVVRFTLSGALPTCTEPPAGGTLVAPDSVCKGINMSLTVSGASNAARALSYQWQSSVDSNDWTNIGTMSDDSLIIWPYESKYYRRIINCGSGSDISTAKFLAVKPFSNLGCVCTPKNTFNSCSNYISRVQLGTLDNASGCDSGYRNYSDSIAPLDWLLTASKNFTVNIATVSSGTRYIEAWIDFNHDGQFNDGLYVWQTPTANSITGTITMPANAMTGLTRMRIRYIPSSAILSNPAACGEIYSGSEAEDYLLNVIDAFACTSLPASAITTVNATAVCAADSIFLGVSGLTPSTTYSYQWQSSRDGVVWQDINTAKAANCVAYQDNTRYYRARVGCADQYIYTTPVKVDMKPTLQCYCKVFRSGCNAPNEVIKRVVFGTLDHPSGCVSGGYIDYADSVAAPLIRSGETIPMQVAVGNGLTNYINVWIDYNMNGEFEVSEHTYIGGGSNVTLTKTINIPAGLNPGLTKMRIRERYNSNFNPWDACNYMNSAGETEDYLVRILAAKVCAPAGNSNCGNGDFISGVLFAGVDTVTTCSTNGYGDFTEGSQTATITANTYVPLSVEVGCGTNGRENVGVWIDFNQNGFFERNEFTLVGRDCGNVVTNNVSIPTNAKAGLTIMRIRTTPDSSFNPSDACTSLTYGETEDYNVVAQPYTTCPTNYWTGLGGDEDWDNPNNWSCQEVPGVHSNVVINSGVVGIGSNVTVYSLNVNPAATLTVYEPYKLTITH